MKKFRITARDLRFFFFGLITMFVFVLIYDWDNFKRGFYPGTKAASIERSE